MSISERVERMTKRAEARYVRAGPSGAGRCPHVSEMFADGSVRCELLAGHGPVHRCSVEHVWRNDA